MACTKNVGGGPSDDDRRPPPRQPAGPKGKAMKQVTSKKRKYPDAETARAAAVAEATEHAERGGARSGVVIADPAASPAAAADASAADTHAAAASWVHAACSTCDWGPTTIDYAPA